MRAVIMGTPRRPHSRPRPELGQAQLIELPLVHERLARPGAEHHLEGLLHALAAVVAPETIAYELVLVVVGAVSHPDIDAAVGEIVEERELGGEADGMTESELDHREGDTDPLSPRRDHAGERDGIAVDALAREIVLGEPDAIEAGSLGEAGFGHEVADGCVVTFR